MYCTVEEEVVEYGGLVVSSKSGEEPECAGFKATLKIA